MHKRSLLAILVVSFSLAAHAHDYAKLSATGPGQFYVNAIESDRLYPVSRQSFNQLHAYYKDMKLKNPWEDKSRILNDSLFYSSVKSFSGEVCAMLWRYDNHKPHKVRAGGAEIKVELNKTQLETTPFYDRNSPWYSKRYAVTYAGRQNAYLHFLPPGKQFEPDQLGFAIHQTGAFFGYGRGRGRHLVFSMQTYFLAVKDGDIVSDGTLIERDIALISPIYIPMSIGELGSLKTEKQAFEQCQKQAQFILPLWQ
ncbi:hypothetical protein [Vibrio sp. WXL103]|uniref:hypothetical protein n=1 Tax=Vibrio sp. WXL103 TaxID=3450710 RepID=UPI003EC620D9